MAIQELFYDNEYEFGMFKYAEKSRLLRCVDRKGEHLWWDWRTVTTITGLSAKGKILILIKAFAELGREPDETIDEEVRAKAVDITNKLIEQAEVTDSEGGYTDYTPLGEMFELTEEDRNRALKKVVKLK